MIAIRTEEISKQFGDLVAVDHVSLEIESGELFGMLGPNGAGKTTFTKMLATLLKPTSGYAEVWGNNVILKQDEVRRCVGVVFQDLSIDDKLTGRENLDFHARMYGMRGEVRASRIAEVLDLVDLTDKADIQLEAYSGGMQRRVALARALISQPGLLLLDEPFIGVDELTREKLYELLESIIYQSRIPCLFVTHNVYEAVYLADRIAVMTQVPATIADVLTVNIPRPRKPRIRNESKFINLVEKLRGLLSSNGNKI